MAQKYTVSQMKEMAKLYAQRMLTSSSSNLIDLNYEGLVLHLDKTDVEHLLNQPGATGLFVVLGLDTSPMESNSDPTQSVILVPCDSKGKAVETDNAMTGTERFLIRPPKLHDIIYPNGTSGGVNILDGIDNAFDAHGIVD